jgi:hypothetical protein
VPGGGKPSDVADLGDDQHRGVAADAVDLAQKRGALVSLGVAVDLAPGRVDFAVEVIEEREQAVQPLPRRLAQLKPVQELPSGFSE